MTVGFVLPTVLGVLLIVAMGRVEWHLRPSVAVPALTGLMILAASGVVLIVGATASAFALGPARAAAVTDWCRSIPLHHEIDPVVGSAAVTLVILGALRCGRILLARRRAVASAANHGRVAILESPSKFAYAVPTRTGCVVVSTGLLSPLSAQERKAVFAHERAHLRLGHHHYLLAAELSIAILPFLAPILSQLQHATERAADEAAAATLSGERKAVATAIATTALGMNVAGALPTLGGGSVTRRVEALLWPHREPVAGRLRSAAVVAGGVSAALALAVQLHHFSTLVDHLCRGTS